MDAYLAIEHNLILHSLREIVKNYDFIDKVVILNHLRNINDYTPINTPSILLTDFWKAQNNQKFYDNLPEYIAGKPLAVVMFSTNPHEKLEDFEGKGLYEYIAFNTPFPAIEKRLKWIALHIAANQQAYGKIKLSESALADVSRRTGLTSREIQILYLVCKEYSSDEIGKMLMINKRTLELYRRKLFAKIGSSSVLGLVRYAIKNRLFPDFPIPQQ